MTPEPAAKVPALTTEQRAWIAEATGLVGWQAQRVSGRYPSVLSRSELEALGHWGLVDAARNYDPTSNASFATFAKFRVQGAMPDGIRKEAHHWQTTRVAASIGACEYASELRHSRDILSQTDENAKEHLSKIADGLAASMFAGLMGAIDHTHDEESKVRRESYREAINALNEAVDGLQVKDRKLIELHYKNQLDLKVVAKRLGVSYSTVRRQHSRAIDSLAKKLALRGIKHSPTPDMWEAAEAI